MPFDFHGLIILFVLGLVVGGTIFWIWMLVDCAINKRISDSRKLIWILVILFTHWLGAILYFFLGRSRRQPQNAYQPDAQPQRPRAEQASYYPYQEGYQAAQPVPPPYQASPMSPPVSYEQMPSHDYEQPQAMYPHEQNNE
jgi:Phospholipase_D-nuclease N-terminal